MLLQRDIKLFEDREITREMGSVFYDSFSRVVYPDEFKKRIERAREIGRLNYLKLLVHRRYGRLLKVIDDKLTIYYAMLRYLKRIGGIEVYNSNWGQSVTSFAPNRLFEFSYIGYVYLTYSSIDNISIEQGEKIKG